jgi:hypothetical protein
VKARLVWVFAIAVVVLRLYLTGDRDILALNSPHDEFWYIDSAFNGIWGGRYDEMTLIHLPVYSAWLALIDLIGIPARLAIDVAWLAASGYLAFAVARLVRSTWPGLLLFAFLAFHPYVVLIFDRALAETLLTVLTAAVLGAGIELWRRRDEGPSRPRRAAFAIYVAGFALAYQTRTEGVVLLAPLLVLGAWSLYDRRHWWRGDRRRLSVHMLVLPVVSALLLGVAIAGANYAKWGVWATQELAASGYKSAMAALSGIDAGPTPKQITVTREMMALAFRESPTFRELQPAMDGAVGAGWVAIARPYVSAPGEIGNGWFYWALRDVAARTGWHADARLAEQKYAAMAAELNKAFDDGRLKRRRLPSSFVDPDVAKWAPDVPASLGAIARQLVAPRPDFADSPAENASPRQFDRYAVVAERRHPVPRVSLNGWTIAPSGSLIGLASADGQAAWQPLGAARPDMPGAYAFALTARDTPAPTSVVLQTPEGVRKSVAIANLSAGKTAPLEGGGIVGIDGIETGASVQRAGEIVSSLVAVYVRAGYLFCFFVAAAVAMLVLRAPRGAVELLIALSVAGIGARIFLLAVLDASSWNGAQPRYMMPALPFFASAGVLSLCSLCARLKANRSEQASRKVPG